MYKFQYNAVKLSNANEKIKLEPPNYAMSTDSYIDTQINNKAGQFVPIDK